MSFRTILFNKIPKIITNHYCNIKILSVPQPQHNLKFQNQVIVSKRFQQNKPIKCWQCGIERTNISELFCEKCHYIQSPHETDNYFKIFELNEDFDVDQKQLTQKYRKMQSLLHPDKFTTKSTQEKDISEEFSALVNRAYNILQSPLKRALHLLYLKGGAVEEGQRVDDPEFLMEIMELNEEVENADDDEKLIKLKQKNDKEIAKITKLIKEAFDDNEIDKAKENIIKMKYYNSVSLHINSLIREKGIVE